MIENTAIRHIGGNAQDDFLPQFEIAAIILSDQDNRLLLMQRDDISSKYPNLPFPNCWDVHGGHIEQGESPEEAMLRELQEEIGWQPKNYNLFATYAVHKGDVAPNIKYIFQGILDTPFSKLTFDEGQDHGLFTLAELNGLEFANVIKMIINDYLAQ